MKKLVTAILMLVSLAQAMAALAYPFLPAEGVLRVNAYLRAEPDIGAQAVRTVEKDTVVIIEDVVNEWMYVRFGQSKGYIRGDLFYDTTKMESGLTLAGQNQGDNRMSSWLPSVLLRIGMRGENVRQLQEALSTLGYSALAIDGEFNGDTESMVKAFQENYGLTPDGIVGDETRSVLNDALSFYRQMN